MSLDHASDPAAYLTVLRSLGQNTPYEVLETVLRNPNTPAEVLFRFGFRVPEALLENPVLPLLLLENPRWFNEMPQETALKLAMHPSAWDELLLLAVQGRPHVRLALTQRPNPPKMVLDKLLRDRNPQVRLAASLHTNLMPEPEPDWMERADAHLMAFLKGLTPSTWEGELFRLCLRHAPLPDFIFEIMASHGQEYVRVAVAENPFFPLSLKAKLLNDRSVAVQEAAQRAGERRGLKTHIKPSVWDQALGKTYESETLIRPQSLDDLLEMAQSPDVALREAVALHPDTPVETLVTLAKSQEMRIQRAVARNPNTPPEVLEEILSDLRHIERDLAEQNPVMQQIVMNLLARSKEPYFAVFYLVQCPVLQNERFQSKLFAHSWMVRYALARHPEMPTEWWQALLEDPNCYVRAMAKMRSEVPQFRAPVFELT